MTVTVGFVPAVELEPLFDAALEDEDELEEGLGVGCPLDEEELDLDEDLAVGSGLKGLRGAPEECEAPLVVSAVALVVEVSGALVIATAPAAPEEGPVADVLGVGAGGVKECELPPSAA